MTLPDTPRRTSRFWLFAPFVLLALVVCGWSMAWFAIKNQTEAAVDAWLATETRAGRQWNCPQRSIGGFPFRIEVACRNMSLQQADLKLDIAKLISVAQIYRPRHIITELEGPLKIVSGDTTIEANWRLFQNSLQQDSDGQRGSVVIEAPVLHLSAQGQGDLVMIGEKFEAHVRPSLAHAGENALDLVIRATQTVVPALDDLVGGSEAADLEVQMTATQALQVAAASPAVNLDLWRQAGGRIDLALLSLVKGSRRIEAKGELKLDDLHRPQGFLSASATGLQGLLGNLTGDAKGGLLGALLKKPKAVVSSDPALTPLPIVKFQDGRFSVGPIAFGKIAPLY